MTTWIFDELGRPTPIGTAASSLAFVFVLGLLVILVNALRSKKKAPEDPNGIFSRARQFASSFDRSIRKDESEVAKALTATPARISVVVGTLRPTRARL